ncbi:hypothetical protein IFO69_10665 [Echinicola sp. CAU 1574]|uniref:Uncharacterized protein n=1 Tax=Echinicola arenosa TaxID=2774144 RepID=A0ABR9AK56_9BACT|nr:hypothetical protein [Echinicola arenosa]MBD8489207.1 hypothetical protein [Echinicola arenosa]
MNFNEIYFDKSLLGKCSMTALIFVLLLLSYPINGQQVQSDEAKVDYLQRIYFSGENKEGIVKNILITIQELKGMTFTPALEKQYIFLNEIEGQVAKANDACEALDLLAVGIYNIDPTEAASQGVILPSEEAKVKSSDAMANFNKINTNAKDISRVANSANMNSIAGTSSTVGDAAKMAGEAGEIGKELADLGKSIGILKKKDKPCKNVTQKDIPIGVHLVSGNLVNSGAVSQSVETLTTVITISNMDFSSFNVMVDTLSSNPNIKSLDKKFNEDSSSITVVHIGSTDDLADWVHEKFKDKVKLVAFETGLISLVSEIE